MANEKMTNAEARSLIEVLNELTNNKVSFSAKVWYAHHQKGHCIVLKVPSCLYFFSC